MLVLTRKRGQKIIIEIGEVDIEIVVKQIRTATVQLGISAPKDWRIRRNELPSERDNGQA